MVPPEVDDEDDEEEADKEEVTPLADVEPEAPPDAVNMEPEDPAPGHPMHAPTALPSSRQTCTPRAPPRQGHSCCAPGTHAMTAPDEEELEAVLASGSAPVQAERTTPMQRHARMDGLRAAAPGERRTGG